MNAEFDFILVSLGDNDTAISESISTIPVPTTTLPIGLPPLLPELTEHLQEKFICNIDELPINRLDNVQCFWHRQKNPTNLYEAEATEVQSTIVVKRNPTTGELLDYEEAFVDVAGLSGQNSTSMKRRPGSLNYNVRGSGTDLPFWPGGLEFLEEPDLCLLKNSSVITDLDLDKDLLDLPPGFTESVVFERKPLQATTRQPQSVLDIRDILADDTDDYYFPSETHQPQHEDIVKKDLNIHHLIEENSAVDDIIKLDHRQESAYDAQIPTVPGSTTYDWAVNVDISAPVDDFYKRVPDMAYKWPFELDTFQKQAILHLENHDNVFVAAHTSAGKTVIAEYAISLAMKHLTKSVYTSPIKALSNQKFRDFKRTFGDVGLITGDVQLRPEAACLIMTTEILRLMLYNGAQIIRDLEWVIFDEVHYINDTERGVVWEEVLIMLPDHVNIVLLSATVPNTMMFADWIGRIKKRKVFVVSTTKRPVPLEHFLYTGNSSKTSDQLYLLVDNNKQFLTTGYSKALEAKKERGGKLAQSYGAKGVRDGHPQHDKNVWLSIIDMLRKKDKLPLVAFTFSKKRIEEHAHSTGSVDLLTEREKSQVHMFYNKSIARLKGTDRALPQVMHLQELLKRGFGIHHSGVLPILKEVVEMLFQDNLVKVLFATETFAMGVNMPARTVVFDSIRKNDGTQFRDLHPGEYIQMAGRAGRRGLDSTGTVIILCKGDVPEMSDLHRMMLGKPTQLQSQFRLTYSMILNLMRVDQLRIEDMMKRSFSEVDNQRNTGKHQQELVQVSEELEQAGDVIDSSGDLETYYERCEEYWDLKHQLQATVLTHPVAVKCLTAGRVVILEGQLSSTTCPTLGLILQVSPRDRSCAVLVLVDEGGDGSAVCGAVEWPRPYTGAEVFRPRGACGSRVHWVKYVDIRQITVTTLKVSGDKVVEDFKKRQIPRFKDDPPSQSTSTAAQQLLRLLESDPRGPACLDPLHDLHLRDLDLVESYRRIQFLEQGFERFTCVHHPGFTENFEDLRRKNKLKRRKNQLSYLLSEESLQFLPEYQHRVQVLMKLDYIDSNKVIQLKGRVACEISNHELMITELLFNNFLSNLTSTQIAAILSSVVFEQRNCSEPKLSPDLQKVKEDFVKVATDIGNVQRECGLDMPVENYVQQFKFGLMEVVFEWARGMPFSEITGLTDVQEGIIVRCIQRLDETIKDVRNAARIIGDPVLYTKMEEASTQIKRDIVFAASLYTQ